MAHTASSKAFRRTSISLQEQAIGGVLIALLLLIGGGIAFKGTHYDPTTYTGDPGAMESTRLAVEGKAATLRESADLRNYEQAAPTAANPAAEAIPVLVEGLVPMGPTERYDADSLFEKINGRAPAYLAYNFQSLTSRSFSISSAPGEYIDIYLFRMDTPLNAFGIFSAERDPTGTPLPFAADGYLSEMGLFMRAGAVYVQTLASSTSPEVMRLAEEATRALSAFLPANDTGLEGRLLLPQAGQVPGTLTYISDNAYGQAALSGVFEAGYDWNGTRFTVFAQSTPDTDTARANWDSLRRFFTQYGSLETPASTGEIELFVADMFGEWTLTALHGPALLGIVNASDPAAARAFLDQLLSSAPTPTPAAPPATDPPAEVIDDYAY